MTETNQNPENLETVIRGTITRVTFRNQDNGYSVLQMEALGALADGPVTVVGNCLNAAVGTHIVARGEFNTHPKFGRQFKAQSITETLPSSVLEIEKYLSSGVIKGIGLKTAQRIVEVFGEKALEVAEKDPDKFAQETGIGKHKAKLLLEGLSQNFGQRESLRFLLEHDISQLMSHRILKLYEGRTVELIKKDPYRLAREVSGIGFSTADSIAMRLGIKTDAPQRLKAGLMFALEKAADDGHCFLPRNLLYDKARLLLQIGEDLDLEPALNALLAEDFLIEDENCIYLPYLDKAEKFVAQFIASRCQINKYADLDSAEINRAIETAQKEQELEFSFEQKQTLTYACQYPLTVITGGPGCGKTTVIKALSVMYRQAGKRLLLAAPTGRAAQRISEVCSLPASTIHRLLKYDPIKRRFLYGISEPLIADAVIIDEASMIDIQLAMHLFSAISPKTVLILVGDKDQLPSVGAGRLLGDILATKEVKSMALTQLFRRSDQSSINTVAHSINCGQVPEIPAPDGVTKTDAYFLARSDAEEASQTIEKLVSDQIPKKFNIQFKDISVLTPSNRGPLGTQVLNQRLQEKLNPKGSIDSEQEILINGVEYRVGDRVCQRVNNYNLGDYGVFNGDIGQIYSINNKDYTLTVEMWDGRLVDYQRSDIGQLGLAYAMTVHKSQGCEFPCVILALHDSHYTLLERQLIYTAVTRAKKLLIVVGSKRALALAAKRMSVNKRCTRLQERIQAILD